MQGDHLISNTNYIIDPWTCHRQISQLMKMYVKSLPGISKQPQAMMMMMNGIRSISVKYIEAHQS